MVETRAARQRKLADTTVVVDGVAIVQKHDYFALWVLARQTSVPLPTDAVKVIFRDFLDTGATLQLTFKDLHDHAARAQLCSTLHFLIDSFVHQPDLEVVHEDSECFFQRFVWRQTVELPDDEERKMFDARRGEHWTSRGSYHLEVPFPGFVGLEVPDIYEDMVRQNYPTCDLDAEDQDTMIAMVRNATVIEVADGDDDEADDCIYVLNYRDLKWKNDWHELDGLSRDDPTFGAIDAFTRGKPDRWLRDSRVRFRLGDGCTAVYVRNVVGYPNGGHGGTAIFASDYRIWNVGEDPGHLEILKSANTDGPPWQPIAEVLGSWDGTFGVNSLMQSVFKTKSHKVENWYERFHRVNIDVTDEAIFIDIEYDYGT